MKKPEDIHNEGEARRVDERERERKREKEGEGEKERVRRREWEEVGEESVERLGEVVCGREGVREGERR